MVPEDLDGMEEISQSGLRPADPDWTGVSPLGSGSDYTAFLQRYGVST